MLSPHAPAVLFVLLLIPNTTWRDWRAAPAPRLQALLRTGWVAAMNDRTAERDRITAPGGARSLLAGARLPASGSVTGLGYAARADNLAATLARAGIATVAADADAASLTGLAPPADSAGHPALTGRAAPPTLLVATAPADWPRADAAVARWRAAVRRAAPGSALLIASPNPSPAEYRRYDQLAPVALWRPGDAAAPGLLTSLSTHHAGLITAADIAPTVAALLRAGPLVAASYGQPCGYRAMPSDRALATVTAIASRAQRQARGQRYVPYAAAALALVIALISAVGARRVGNHSARGRTALLRAGALLAGALPVALALSETWPEVALALAAAALLCRGGRSGARWEGARVAGWSLLMTSLLTALSAHAPISGALLSYSPLEGARYYGVGNETMGIAAGAAAVVTGRCGDSATRPGRWSGALIWIALALLLGWPTMGAKAGGVLVAMGALAGYVIAATAARRAAGVGIALAAALAAAGLLALLGHAGATHLSRALASGGAGRGHASALPALALRKAAMDLRLVLHSAWMLALAASLLGAALLARAAASIRGAADAVRLPALPGRVTLVTSGAAILSCLVFNDAGVVAAALCATLCWSNLALALL